MTPTVNFDELKKLHDRARIAKPGSKDWLEFATTMLDSFPALYATAKAMNARMAELQAQMKGSGRLPQISCIRTSRACNATSKYPA